MFLKKYNMKGKQVFQKSYPASSDGKSKVNEDNLVIGLYMIETNWNKESFTTQQIILVVIFYWCYISSLAQDSLPSFGDDDVDHTALSITSSIALGLIVGAAFGILNII